VWWAFAHSPQILSIDQRRTWLKSVFFMLRVTEIFRSIQGESTHAGRPCTFVRLTGCPMRCVWCDSEYTFTGGEYFALDDVMNQVRAFACKLVEVTGGEPLAQREAFTLIERLCSAGFEVLVETGGFVSTADVDPRARIILDVKCPASGEDARNHWPNLERLRPDKDEVKFVVANFADWNYALGIIKRYELTERTRAILISPAWDAVDLKCLAEWVSGSGLDVRMQLQLHKYIWGPEARGV
jgi:7-carboxy-7-deazaguanine synthase